jgi:hypothetical protein
MLDHKISACATCKCSGAQFVGWVPNDVGFAVQYRISRYRGAHRAP